MCSIGRKGLPDVSVGVTRRPLSADEVTVSKGAVATGNAGFLCPGAIMLRVGWF